MCLQKATRRKSWENFFLFIFLSNLVEKVKVGRRWIQGKKCTLCAVINPSVSTRRKKSVARDLCWGFFFFYSRFFSHTHTLSVHKKANDTERFSFRFRKNENEVRSVKWVDLNVLSPYVPLCTLSCAKGRKNWKGKVCLNLPGKWGRKSWKMNMWKVCSSEITIMSCERRSQRCFYIVSRFTFS